MTAKPTVIYVMADVRSGSTLLENILSKSQQAVSVGELALLKAHLLKQGPGARWNWNCSCGLPITDCNFWKSALQGIDVNQPAFATAVQWNYRSKRLLAGSFISSFFKKAFTEITNKKVNRQAAETINNIYRNIFTTTGKLFIIDSSKDPLQAYTIYLNKPADFDVKIVYLHRDLRAIAASKVKWSIVNKKHKQKSLGKFLTNSLFYKKICNYLLHVMPEQDMVTISYEDLAVHTQQQLDAITLATGMQPYTAPQYMVVENDHTIAGTPQRFTKRPIAYDTTWHDAYNKKPLLYYIGNLMNKI